MNRLAYIAGPYAAGTPAEVAVNVHRAVALGHLAALCGHAPVVPHAMGAMGVYGDPSERGGVSRALALRCGRDLAGAVGAAGGALWVIEHDRTSRDAERARAAAGLGSVGARAAQCRPRPRRLQQRAGMSMLGPRVVLVGELDPYGADPRYALFDEPKYSAGGRLRRLVLGLPRRVYLGDDIERGNLCTGRWTAAEANQRAAAVLTGFPQAVIVMLGRKVATAFARARKAPVLAPYTRDGRLVAIPHPSGLCREWADPTAVPRVRALLAEAAPGIPWGSA